MTEQEKINFLYEHKKLEDESREFAIFSIGIAVILNFTCMLISYQFNFQEDIWWQLPIMILGMPLLGVVPSVIVVGIGELIIGGIRLLKSITE